MIAALWTGPALGFFVGAQVGPVRLLCARTTLRSGVAAVALVLGVALGSLAWHAVLVAGMRLLRRRVGDRTLRVVDVVAGIALVRGGAGLAVRAVRAE